MTCVRSTGASQSSLVVLVLSLGTLAACAVGCGDDKAAPLAPTPSPAPVSTPASITLHATGTVVENGGGPVPDAIVDVWRCGGDVVLVQTLTGSAGEFSLTVDAPPGNWCVRAHKEGYTWMATAPAEAITLNLQRLRKTTGTVVEVDGSPVPGAKVYADGASTLTDGKGSFSLERVGYFLSLAADGYVSRQLAVPAGQDLALGTLYIQRQIAMSGASRLESQISSADVAYDLSDIWEETYGAWCEPCKWINLDTGQRELSIHLQWSGESPLQLWSTAGNPYLMAQTATAGPGETALSLRVPATTRHLLVGIRMQSGQSRVFQQPVPFELTTSVP